MCSQFNDHHPSSNPALVTPGPVPHPDNAGAQMMSPTVLQDAFSQTNITNPAVGGFLIAGDVVNLALQSCCPRRNLAAQLATKLYTLRERAGSNCHGKQGKTALDRERDPLDMHTPSLLTRFSIQGKLSAIRMYRGQSADWACALRRKVCGHSPNTAMANRRIRRKNSSNL